MPLVPVTF